MCFKSFKKKNSIEPDALKKELQRKEEIRRIKAENKLERKKQKAKEKKTIRQNRAWFNFFTGWFFLGIILVLISIGISMYFDKVNVEHWAYEFRFAATIIANIFSTVGIALFVGCIFDFSKNSEVGIK